MRNQAGLGLGLLLLATGSYSQPPPQPPTQPTVVELFTAEGCSSCPPAEELIGVLSARRPDVIPLAFHVDYWDNIGWRDRFEIPEAAARQRQYQHALHLNTVYTPQLVIDGQRDVVGGNNPAIIPVGAHVPALPLGLEVRDQQVSISLGAGNQKATGEHDVLLVSYLREGVSKVTRGENSGRELHEFNIVRSIQRLGGWNGEARTFSVPVKSLPQDATHVAVLVQVPNEGPIVAAAASAVR